jgi:NAD(P)-dependent dehydrogenase (short-subunit alcohol dehydrogenase family)
MSKTILERFRLDGRVALITGAGQGIGKAFACALGEAGAIVAIADMRAELAEQVSHELQEKHVQTLSVTANVSDPQSVEAMVKKVIDHFGGLHIAFNNAGINKNSAAEETPLEEWDQTFAVNLRGLFVCCQAEARYMLKAGYGKIINTASMSSLIVPHPQKQAAYNTSKGGVVNLTRAGFQERYVTLWNELFAAGIVAALIPLIILFRCSDSTSRVSRLLQAKIDGTQNTHACYYETCYF